MKTAYLLFKASNRLINNALENLSQYSNISLASLISGSPYDGMHFNLKAQMIRVSLNVVTFK